MLAIRILLCLFVLTIVGAEAKEKTKLNRWLSDPVVLDYTPDDWSPLVQEQVAAWDRLVPVSMTYQNMDGDCPGHTDGAIVVCYHDEVRNYLGAALSHRDGKSITGATISLFSHEGFAREKRNTVCHELAHALLWVGHNVDKKSCVHPDGPNLPGKADARMVREAYNR
jgi:hypothetical protein